MKPFARTGAFAVANLRFVPSTLLRASFIVLVLGCFADEPAPPQSTPPANGGKVHPEMPNVTEAQKEQMRQLVETHRVEAEPIFQRLLTARRARLEAILATPTNETKIRDICADYAKAETESAIFISKLYNELLPVLTGEQRVWLNNHKDDLERYFEVQIARGLDRFRQREKQQQGQ